MHYHITVYLLQVISKNTAFNSMYKQYVITLWYRSTLILPYAGLFLAAKVIHQPLKLQTCCNIAYDTLFTGVITVLRKLWCNFITTPNAPPRPGYEHLAHWRALHAPREHQSLLQVPGLPHHPSLLREHPVDSVWHPHHSLPQPGTLTLSLEGRKSILQTHSCPVLNIYIYECNTNWKFKVRFLFSYSFIWVINMLFQNP